MSTLVVFFSIFRNQLISLVENTYLLSRTNGNENPWMMTTTTLPMELNE